MTWAYLQRAKKRHETVSNKQIFRLFYNMGQTVLFFNTFSTQHLVAVIRALFHGESCENRASSIYYHASSVNHHMYFLQDIRFIFFCLSFVTAREGRGYYFSSSLPLPHRKSFSLQHFHLAERFNDERRLRKQI